MNTLKQQCLNQLAKYFDEAFTSNQTICENHGRDDSYHDTAAPDAVIFPETTKQVIEAVKICAAHKIPIIPYGAGTSLEGHVLAIEGGVCIDLSKMNRIINVDSENMSCTVEAGVTRKQLNQYLRDTGLMFPIDPGADATLGGMVSTSASGTNAVRYGTMKNNVLSLNVVMANGDEVSTGCKARKTSAGYDLNSLLVSSEGTLGIITEVTVKLYGIPESTAAGICNFDSLQNAVNTVVTTIQNGISVARIELLDSNQIKAINHYNTFNYPLKPTLWFELHGSESAVAEQSQWLEQTCRDNDGEMLEWSTDREQGIKLWQARHQAWFANHAIAPGKQGMTTDVCVPISKLTECIIDTQNDIASSSLFCSIIGHVGDGNFHVIIMLDKNNPVELAEAKRINENVVRRAQLVGGTCTGEHGIGLGKIAMLREENKAAVQLMRQIKVALDPDNIMNPGKIFSQSDFLQSNAILVYNVVC